MPCFLFLGSLINDVTTAIQFRTQTPPLLHVLMGSWADPGLNFILFYEAQSIKMIVSFNDNYLHLHVDLK